MNGKRSKWIRKVIISRHPKVLEMLKEKYGEEIYNKMTYRKVINACKRMWKERAPGVEEWEIYKKAKES